MSNEVTDVNLLANGTEIPSNKCITKGEFDELTGQFTVRNGDIVLPDKTTVTLQQYKDSGRDDAIGVVFDARKGLFVKKDMVNGVLVVDEGPDNGIFYKEIGCRNPYDGKEVQKLVEILFTSLNSKVPVFYKAYEQKCYVASNGEIEKFKNDPDVLESLQYIGSAVYSSNGIFSATQDPKATSMTSAVVFYHGKWDQTRSTGTPGDYALIDFFNLPIAAKKYRNGDIVLPDKTTMPLDDYQKSGRKDAIGVVFDDIKGLYVQKFYIEGILVVNGSKAGIFYKDTANKSLYDGKIIQKLMELSFNNLSGSAPLFYKVMDRNQNEYIASNGELEKIMKSTVVKASLQAIGSDLYNTQICSCTQNAKKTTAATVFYNGYWRDEDSLTVNTTRSYALINML